MLIIYMYWFSSFASLLTISDGRSFWSQVDVVSQPTAFGSIWPFWNLYFVEQGIKENIRKGALSRYHPTLEVFGTHKFCAFAQLVHCLLAHQCNLSQLTKVLWQNSQVVKRAIWSLLLNETIVMLVIFLMACWTLAVPKQVRGRGGRCSLFLTMRCFNDAMFSNS